MLLMEVLTDGDEQLYEKAVKVINDCAKELGFSQTLQISPMIEPVFADDALFLSRSHPQEVFLNTFSARDIAESFRVLPFVWNQPIRI